MKTAEDAEALDVAKDTAEQQAHCRCATCLFLRALRYAERRAANERYGHTK